MHVEIVGQNLLLHIVLGFEQTCGGLCFPPQIFLTLQFLGHLFPRFSANHFKVLELPRVLLLDFFFLSVLYGALGASAETHNLLLACGSLEML